MGLNSLGPLETVSMTLAVAAVKDYLSPYKIHLIWISLCTVSLVCFLTPLKILEITRSGQAGSSTASVLFPTASLARQRVGKVLRGDKAKS